jgi:hypothetical protein
MGRRMANIVQVNYGHSGQSQNTNALGMRPMQERVYRERGAQYLLVKAPPASGKSRALMFVALDKLDNQDIRKAIVAVPERTIGGSFSSTKLSSYGFSSDWEVNPEWNLCTAGADTGTGAKSKVQAFKNFIDGSDQVLVCTHATLRYSFNELGAEHFDNCVLAVDEFHHVSSSEESKLGELVRTLMERDRVHLVAMTGSYFRGDAEMVLRPEDEAKFTRVTYTYYEQLNGYDHLRSLGIGYHFYRGTYLDAVMEVLDTNLKTIVHIPNVNAIESTGDKYAEVDRILGQIGSYKGVDEASGFVLVERSDGRVLKIANLVDDDPNTRSRVVESLRHSEDRTAVDLIIALGMAKEGFDWIWCEHALTIGYRNSLTEIVQIIGRATRDAPDKRHAQFTNLIAEPDASSGQVVNAVNDMLKAISASLLMEQVLAPNFKFTPRRKGLDDDEPDIESDPVSGEIRIGIRGLEQPSSERVREIVEQDMNDLIATVCQDQRTAILAAANESIAPETVNQVFIPRIIEERYPDLGEQQLEEVRQQLVSRMNVVAQINDGAQRDSGNAGILNMVRRFINVRELDIDLIDKVNPFQRAYEVMSKSMDAPTLAQVHSAIAAQRVEMTEEEAVSLWPRIKRFKHERGHHPNVGAEDPMESRLADALAWLRRKKREQMQARAETEVGG